MVFPIWLAILDFVPVLLFSIAIIKVAVNFKVYLFIVGAVITATAGLMKASWKLIKAIKNKDINWLNKSFFKMLMTGFVLMIIALFMNLKKVDLASIFAMPRLIFIIACFVLFIFMAVYRKTKFEKNDFKTNLIGEIINTLAMSALLIATMI